MWYDLPPRQYGSYLISSAERNEAAVVRQTAERRFSWEYHVSQHARQAVRLRAMAKLCDQSTAARAGDVDFRGLNSPRLSVEDENRIVAEILGEKPSC